MIGFAFPTTQLHWWLGLGVALIALLVVVLRRLEARRRLRLSRFIDAQLAPRLLLGFDDRVRRPLFWFTVFGFAFLLLALAEPRWGQDWIEVSKHSHDIMVCLDTSESMRARSPLPNRLERAKQKVASILERAPGDRYGLVVFAGDAEVLCPLTVDHGYFRAILSAVDTDVISAMGTNIAAAIERAVDLYREEAEQSGDYDKDSRAILLISDGEEVSGDAVLAAEAASEYARVYVIGVGDPTGTEIEIADWRGRGAMRGMERTHVSRLDEDTLRQIAVVGKGGYIRSTASNEDIEQIYNLINRYASRKTSSDVRLRLVNRYQWPLAVAVVLLMLEGFWGGLLGWFRLWRMRREDQRHV